MRPSAGPGPSNAASRQVLGAGALSPILVVTQVIITGVLARLLTPADFGSYAIASSVVALAAHLGQRGLSMALVRSKDVTADEIGDYVVVASAVGAAAALGVLLLAPAIAGLTNLSRFGPQGTSLIRLTSIPIALSIGTAPLLALMQKRMAITALTLFSLVSLVIGNGLVAVLLAWRGLGAWSLAWGSVVTSLVAALLLLRAPRPTISFRFKPDRYPTVLTSQLRISGLRMLDLIWAQLPVWAAAVTLPLAQIGIAQRSLYLALMAYQATLWGPLAVTFPNVAKIQDDRDQLKRHFSTSLCLFALLVIPAASFFYANANLILRLMYGSGWADADGIFQIFLVVGCFYSLAQICVTHQEALGLFAQRYRAACLGPLLFGVGLLVVPGRDATWIATAFCVSGILTFFWSLREVTRFLDLSLAEIAAALRPGCLSGAAVLIGGLALQRLFATHPDLEPVALWAGIGAAALIWCAALRFVLEGSVKQQLRESLGFLPNRLIRLIGTVIGPAAPPPTFKEQSAPGHP